MTGRPSLHWTFDSPWGIAWLDSRFRGLAPVCLVCLYIMAGMALWSVALVQLAETILVLTAGIIVYRGSRVILKQPLVWLTLFFITYVVIRGWIASMERPDLYYLHWEEVRRWTKAGLLPTLIVALALWATGRQNKHNMGLLLAALVGLTCLLLANADWSDMLAALRGKGRYTFDMHVAFSSLLFTVSFVGTAVYLPKVVRIAPGGLPGAIAAGIAWGCVSLFYLTALVASGTRASWLAGLVGLLTVCVVGFKARVWRPGPRTASLIVVGVAAVIALGSIVYGPRIADRWQKEADTIGAALELPGEKDIGDLPRSPLSTRIAYNLFGLEQLAKRPVFGYGPAEPRYLRYEREIPHQLEDRNDHFHSQYIDALLRFGLVGFAPIVLLFVFALIGVKRGWQSGRLDSTTGLFIIGFVAIYAVWSLADQRFTNFSMIAIVSIILGIGCSHLLPSGMEVTVTSEQRKSPNTARGS